MDFIVADNQELTRFAIEHLIDGYADRRVFHATCKAELIERLGVCGHCVVIMDFTLFDFLDAENLLIAVQRFPSANWVLVSDDLTEAFLRTIIVQSHNVSILFKDASLKEVADAIDRAANGQRYICQRVTEIMLAKQMRESEHPTGLTPSEIEIIRSIAQGKTTKEIASERYSSIHTINTHRKNIFRKLGVNTAHEAIKCAIRSGLIDEADYFI